LVSGVKKTETGHREPDTALKSGAKVHMFPIKKPSGVTFCCPKQNFEKMALAGQQMLIVGALYGCFG
jgi:hypothetical protein